MAKRRLKWRYGREVAYVVILLVIAAAYVLGNIWFNLDRIKL